eukprot:scaffold1881_cov256-Pinguiococcus_pyrenoidosus.AAC.7
MTLPQAFQSPNLAGGLLFRPALEEQFEPHRTRPSIVEAIHGLGFAVVAKRGKGVRDLLERVRLGQGIVRHEVNPLIAGLEVPLRVAHTIHHQHEAVVEGA